MSHKFHGIKLAQNSYIENAVVERVAGDPAGLEAGRFWFNTTTNTFNFSDLDAGGAIRINTFSSLAALNAAVTSSSNNLATEVSARTAADAAEVTRAQAAEGVLTTDLANEVVNRTNADAAEVTARTNADATVAANAAADDATTAANAATALAAEASTRLAADNALSARDTAIEAEIVTMNSSLGLNANGTYTPPANTTYLGSVTNQHAADVALDTAISTEVNRAEAAEATLTSNLAITNTNLANEITRAEAAEATLTASIASLNTSGSTALSTETAARIAGDAATLAAAEAYTDAKVLKLWADCGSFDASINTYPTTGGTGTAGAILDGDIWTIGVVATAGPLLGLHVGSTIRAIVNAPGQVAADWATANSDLGYTAENSANKSTDGTMAANSTVEYPSQSAVVTYVAAEVAAEATARNAAIAVETAARTAADTATNAILTTNNTSSGFNPDGTLPALTGTTYINGQLSTIAAVKALDVAVATNATDIAAETTARTNADVSINASLAAEVTARTNADTALQTQITSVETGVGLNGDGTYKVPVGSNYLGTTTSMTDADKALDAALQTVSNRTTALETVTVPQLQTQLAAEVTRATTAETTEATARAAADATLNTAINAETTRATGVEATLNTAITTETSRATLSENSLQSQINAIVAASGAGAAALKTELNATRYTYMSAAPALVHTVTHNLNTPFYSANIMVQGTDGIWRNDIMPVEDVDLNSYTITLTESSMVKASGQSNAALA